MLHNKGVGFKLWVFLKHEDIFIKQSLLQMEITSNYQTIIFLAKKLILMLILGLVKVSPAGIVPRLGIWLY